jgi:hypothetical protein
LASIAFSERFDEMKGSLIHKVTSRGGIRTNIKKTQEIRISARSGAKSGAIRPRSRPV